MEASSTDSGEKPHISVWLSNKNSKELKWFRCTICGHKVFGYYNDQKIIMAGLADSQEFSKSPIEVQCHGTYFDVGLDGRKNNKYCNAMYIIG